MILNDYILCASWNSKMPNQNQKKFPEMWHVPVGEDLGIFHAKSFSLNLDQKVARKLDFQVAPDKMNQTNITRMST